MLRNPFAGIRTPPPHTDNHPVIRHEHRVAEERELSVRLNRLFNPGEHLLRNVVRANRRRNGVRARATEAVERNEDHH
jgi:hypothetical protein